MIAAGTGREPDPEVQELLLRTLPLRETLGALAPALDDLTRQVGLYPYLDPESLGLAGLLAYEVHRPDNLDDVVFHRVQAEAYRTLMAGESVVLSAPTSFGKSLIIDAVIASGRYSNVVIVVPTIALIDETRRRLFGRFSKTFKILTHPSQRRGEKNIFVLTQERTLEFPGLNDIDFFVIDEFYKLDPRRDPERSFLLNQAFYQLYRTGATFYLLGPNIREIPVALPERMRFKFIATDYATVVSEITRVESDKQNKLQVLVDLCRELKEPTIVYCASPASARKVAAAFVAAGLGTLDDRNVEAAEWVGGEYHRDWVFAEALRQGMGLHHGRIPRALAQFVVRAFNSGQLKYLICTSTLIEGVNTKAKNVVVFDNKVSTKKVDFFTFNNIKGRSGRMFKHFIGHVYLFNDPPQQELPIVDFPAFTQSATTPESLLVQIDETDLSPESKRRMAGVNSQASLPLEVVRGNRGMEPDAQFALAAALREDPYLSSKELSWTGEPSYANLVAVCDLIWTYLLPDGRRRAGVASGRQMALRIHKFRVHRSVQRLIGEELIHMGDELDPDEAVESVLEFVRYWPTFHFPRLLMAVDRIQRSVFSRLGLPYGDYSYFAARVENSFLPAGIAALDEYGIPIQIATRLRSDLGNPEDVDSALNALRHLDRRQLGARFSRFEAGLIADAQEFV